MNDFRKYQQTWIGEILEAAEDKKFSDARLAERKLWKETLKYIASGGDGASLAAQNALISTGIEFSRDAL